MSQLHIHLAVAAEASFDGVAQTVQASVAATIAQYDCRAAAVSIVQGLAPLAPGIKRRRVQRIA
jgi:hypothetical protein